MSGETERALLADLLTALKTARAEAAAANDVIRLGRSLAGQGRIRVATALHRIERIADAAIAKSEGQQ